MAETVQLYKVKIIIPKKWHIGEIHPSNHSFESHDLKRFSTGSKKTSFSYFWIFQFPFKMVISNMGPYMLQGYLWFLTEEFAFLVTEILKLNRVKSFILKKVVINSFQEKRSTSQHKIYQTYYQNVRLWTVCYQLFLYRNVHFIYSENILRLNKMKITIQKMF